LVTIQNINKYLEEIKPTDDSLNSIISNTNTRHIYSYALRYAVKFLHQDKYKKEDLKSYSTVISDRSQPITLIEQLKIQKLIQKYLKNKRVYNENYQKSKMEFKLIYECLCYTGMRLNELTGINFANERIIYRDEELTGIYLQTLKSLKIRRVYIPNYIFDYFKNNNIILKDSIIQKRFRSFRK
jgi:integrase